MSKLDFCVGPAAQRDTVDFNCWKLQSKIESKCFSRWPRRGPFARERADPNIINKTSITAFFLFMIFTAGPFSLWRASTLAKLAELAAEYLCTEACGILCCYFFSLALSRQRRSTVNEILYIFFSLSLLILKSGMTHSTQHRDILSGSRSWNLQLNKFLFNYFFPLPRALVCVYVSPLPPTLFRHSTFH